MSFRQRLLHKAENETKALIKQGKNHPTPAMIRVFRDVELMQEYTREKNPYEPLLAFVYSHLARVFHFGYGFYGVVANKDERIAAIYAKMSSEMGCSNGMYFWACHMFYGVGVQKNVKRAYLTSRQSAMLGSADAFRNVYACMANGWGVKKNQKEFDELNKRLMRANVDVANVKELSERTAKELLCDLG